MKMSNQTSILKTERTLLRYITLEDAKSMYQYTSDDETMKYLSFPKHTSVEHTEQVIRDVFFPKYKDGKSYDLAVIWKETGEMIGTAGFNTINDGIGVLGYAINKKYWGKGVMTEIVQEFIRFGFEELGLVGVSAYYYEDNHASGKVMSKCGLKYTKSEKKEMPLRGVPIILETHLYELSRETYLETIK